MAKTNKSKKTAKTKAVTTKTTTPKEQKIAKTPAVEEETIAVKPKKKHHVGLILLCVFLTIFIVLPLGFFFIFIFDTSTKSNLQATGELDTSKVMKNIMSDAMKDVKTTKKINMEIGEDELDQVLMAAAKKINVEDYIPRMYSTIEDNHYTLYADLQASFIKSRVAIATTIQYDESSNDIVFHVDKINLGRCGFLTDLIFTVGSRFINDEKLENALNKYGLHVDFNLANHEIRYNEATFRQDMDAILIKALGESNMFNSLISYAITDPDLFEVSFDGAISVAFKLETLGTVPEKYEGVINEGAFDFSNSNEIIKKLYDSGVITNAQEAQEVANFLIKGERSEFVETHAQEIANALGIDDLEVYKPLIEKDKIEDDLINIFKFEEGEDTASFDTSDLEKFTNSLDIVGYTSFIENENKEGEHNLSYICMDNLGVNFIDDEMVVSTVLDINGCPTCFTIPTSSPDFIEDDQKAIFKLDEIYVGGKLIEEDEVKDNLINIIKNNIPSTGDAGFTLDENNNFVLDFSKNKDKITDITISDGKLILTRELQ